MAGLLAADAGEIAGRPSAYFGKPVTVVAEVEAVHGPNAFTLNDRAKLDDGNMWPVAFALKKLTPAEEKVIVALVKKAEGM